MKVCPKCGFREFYVTQHVTQTIKVDGDGYFLKEMTSCDEITHAADDDDMWTCVNCGYNAAGSEFNDSDKKETYAGKMIVHVVEKPGLQKALGVKADNIVKYYLDVWDTRSKRLPFTSRNGEWYNDETKIDMVPVILNSVYAPNPKTYIGSRPGSMDRSDISPEDFWRGTNKYSDLTVIFYLFHNSGALALDAFDKTQLLAAMHYAMHMQIRLDACYVRGYDDRYVKDGHLWPLQDVWNQIAKNGWEAE